MRLTFNFLKIPLSFILFISVMSIGNAQTTLEGNVTASDDQAPLPGASVYIEGTTEGVVSDFDGNFKLTTTQELPFTLVVSYTGFTTKNITVNSASDISTIALEQGGLSLDEVIISASRRPQKIQDAPASVSVVSAKDIVNSAVAVDPMRHLINVPGVQIQQQSANSLNIEMRAGAGVFGTSTFPILDYRYLVTPSAGTLLSYQTGISNIDIQRIEVVRGAASALYGPGVTSGVVHFLTKNPIDYPGTTLELLGGSLETFGVTARHAYASENKKFGYKINMRYMRGNDFELDPVEDAAFIAAQKTSISQPTILNDRVNPSAPGEELLNFGDLDDNGDGNPLASKYANYSANIHLEFRPTEKTSAFLSSGMANGGGLFFNSQGAGYTQGNDYWAQARVQSGGLFAQAYYNYNDGGDEENPTFLYASGFRQIAKRASLEAQLQYNFDVPSFLDTNFTIGTDYRNTSTDSEHTLYGANDDDDDYIITGVYLQGTSKFGEKVELTYAGRYDKFNFIDEGTFAPRVALVYKPTPKSTFRASYNVATFGPSALEQFIDFPVSIVSPGVLDVWLSGQNQSQGFSDNPVIDLSVPGLPDIPYGDGSPQFPLAYAYGAVAQPTLAALYSGLAASPSAAPLLPMIQGFFSSYLPAGGTGQLVGYNLFNGEPLNQLAETARSEIGKLNSFEVGYKGIIGEKWSVGLDVYTYERKGFTNFTAIGPTFSLQGANIATDLGSTISADFAADPTVQATITGAVQAQYTANGIPEVIWATGAPADALFPGSPAIAPIGAVIDGTVQNLAATIGGAFTTGGTGFENAIAPLLSVIGAVETNRVPQGDGITHIPAGYRRFGDAVRSHYGADLSVEYFADDAWSLWGNASWLSQNEWIPGEDNDDGLPFSSYLNAPKFKYRAGVKYSKAKYRGGLSFQHDDEFNSNQGVFSGLVKKKNLLDVNIGYMINDNVSLDLSASNVFDTKYRAFPSMPVIGRRVILKATIEL